MSDELGALLGKAIGGAIEAIVREHEGGFVTKWIGLVETVGPDGERGLWTMTSDELKAWDTVGLLQYASHLQMRRTLFPEDDT